MFQCKREVHFYETDLMGIVHHSNYIRFFEEARVSWAHSKGLIDYQKPETASHFAVLETGCKHLKPTFFGDSLVTDVQVKSQGIRLFFQYRTRNQKNEIVAVGKSVHAPLDKDLRPMRFSHQMKQILEKETWTETWL